MTEPACIDLRSWAKANRYRWRFEDGYRGGQDDDAWFVEVVCHHGRIYPRGGDVLLAYVNRNVRHHIKALGTGVQHHQWDGNNEVFRFGVERLDEVAAILKPKRLGGSAVLTDKQRENLQRHAFRGGQAAQISTQVRE